jgi:hypothetical protein
VNETVIEQALREPFRLTEPAFVERHIGALQNARSVAGSLTMTHEQDRHTESLAAGVRAGEFLRLCDKSCYSSSNHHRWSTSDCAGPKVGGGVSVIFSDVPSRMPSLHLRDRRFGSTARHARRRRPLEGRNAPEADGRTALGGTAAMCQNPTRALQKG